MSDLSGDELAGACAESMYERDVAAQGLGITIKKVKEGFASLEMEVRPDMLNGHGVCHGGFIFALADTAFAYACNSRNRVSLALGCDIDFVQPGKVGQALTAIAEQRSQKGRTGLYDVTITQEEGQTIAHFRGRSYSIDGEVLQDPETPSP